MLGLFQGYRKSHTWIIATGLAQVSEFSIVLGSRARRLRIVTREVSNTILYIRHNTIITNILFLNQMYTKHYTWYLEITFVYGSVIMCV